ncbi:MAG: hypothetical protein ACPKPY_05525 [Nitrososphaeraceae archaeon]
MGNISSTDVSDTDIDKGLDYGTSEVIACTLKNDWDTDTTHALYDKAVTIVEYYASSLSLDRFSGDGEKATRHRDRAVALCTELKTQLVDYDNKFP